MDASAAPPVAGRAQRGDLLRLVLQEALLVVLPGIGLNLLGAAADPVVALRR